MAAKSANSAAFGVNSYSYTIGMTAEQFLANMAGRGYRTFELMVYPGHMWPKDMTSSDRSRLRRTADDRGARIVSLNMANIDVNITAASPDMRELSIDHLERIFALAGDLGVPGVVVGPGKANPLYPMPRDQLLGHFRRAFDRLVPLAEKCGTALYAENMPFAFLPGISELMDAIGPYDAKLVKVLYDVANGWFIKEDIADGLRRAAPRLALVHLSDTGQQVYRHDAVGLGTVPFNVLPPVLAEIGHREAPLLEVISPHADARIDDSVRRLREAGFQPLA
jgi:sugar phosphate isomerase/epimerase